MLANKSKIIDFVCYLLIFLFASLIILPPLLRFVMNKGNEKEITNPLVVEGLRCTLEEEMGQHKTVYVLYKNKKLQSVSITYENYLDESLIQEKSLVGTPGLSEDIEGQKVKYTIEYNDNTKDNSLLSFYFGSIDELKANYESLRYQCRIVSN